MCRVQLLHIYLRNYKRYKYGRPLKFFLRQWGIRIYITYIPVLVLQHNKYQIQITNTANSSLNKPTPLRLWQTNITHYKSAANLHVLSELRAVVCFESMQKYSLSLSLSLSQTHSRVISQIQQSIPSPGQAVNRLIHTDCLIV